MGPLGFQTQQATIAAATYVDNLFSISHSLFGATSILDSFANELYRRWKLSIKPSSRSCTVARGGDDAVSSDLWVPSDTFNVMSHMISNNGSIAADVNDVEACCWRAFFANCARRDVRQVNDVLMARLFGRCVTPIFAFRCPRWPFRPKLANDLDRTQRRMLSCVVKVCRLPDDDDRMYHYRRARAAGAIARKTGVWSALHAARVLSWAQHLRRDRNQCAWAALLLQHRGQYWLRERRLAAGSLNVLAGRTNTRLAAGHVAKRWEDGLDEARLWRQS